MESSFSDKLKKVLKDKNMSQTDLAKKAGVSDTSITNYVKNNKIPKQRILEKITKALNIESAYFGISTNNSLTKEIENENTFSDRLKISMLEKKIDIIELSEKTNILMQSIEEYLLGSYVPKQKNLNKIAEILEVNPFWLLGYSSEKKLSIKSDYSNRTFAENIKKLLDDHNLNQKTFAERINVSQSMISFYLNKKFIPKQDILLKISQEFDIDIQELLGSDFIETSTDKIIVEEILNKKKYDPDVRNLAIIDEFMYFSSFDNKNFDKIIDNIFLDRRIEGDFCVKMPDDSMIGMGISKEDLLIIKKTNSLDYGEIGIFSLKNNFLIRKYIENENIKILKPFNLLFDDISFSPEIFVIGKVTYSMKSFNNKKD